MTFSLEIFIHILHRIYRLPKEGRGKMDLTEKQFSRLSRKSLYTLEKLQQQYTQEFGEFITKEELMALIVRYSREKMTNNEKN